MIPVRELIYQFRYCNYCRRQRVFCFNRDSINIYFGIIHTYTKRGKCETPESIKTLMKNNDFEKEEEYWYGWRHTTINEGYNTLKSLKKEIM